MHELSIALAVAESAEEAARGHGADAVESVRLRVGELSGVVADALRFSFEVIAQGPPLAGAELRIEEVPARARCRACAEEFAPGTPPRLWCPECGEAETELVAGRELEIVDVTLTEGRPCPGSRSTRQEERA
ncbi:hydrogenase maturation nickel metallochaperone HypA [Streptomyces megasporus]|uniref:hydrogenase maturation nickel metallochaperone HypA n=1 Tax=Streptomyces megasporus TaxID=44060 RepID=UPI0004E1C151|nr:hydrogenase maturation nickel metallochaperone HypA [Streptomyces megasporus]